MILPISSIQVRHTDSETRGTFSVVVPTADLVDAIAERRDGELVVTAVLNQQEQTLLRGTLSEIRVDSGPISQSMTLSGPLAAESHEPATHRLEAVSSVSSDSSGAVRLRARPNAALRPGDVVYHAGAYYRLSAVTWSIAATTGGLTATMDLSGSPA